MWLGEPHVREQEKMYHAAAGESGFWAGTPPEQLAPRKSCQFYTTYAVGSKPGVHLNERPDSPPAGRKISFFFIKILHCVQNFYEKDKTSTMLPQAVCVSSGETPGLINHRVSPVSFTRLTQSRTRKIPFLFTNKFTL
jgi:hypothetical protein